MTTQTAQSPLLRAALTLLAVLATALGTTSCGATTRRHPITEIVQADNERVFWNTLWKTIQKDQDFPVGGVGADPVKRSITSGWKVDEVPFGRMRNSEGFRARVIATYQPYVPGSKSAKGVEQRQDLDPEREPFLVTIRVEKEHNKSIRPGIPQFAKWVSADDDEAWATRLMFTLKSNVGDNAFKLKDNSKRNGPPHELDLE